MFDARETARKIVFHWLRVDAPLSVKMVAEPRVMIPLIEAIEAALVEAGRAALSPQESDNGS